MSERIALDNNVLNYLVEAVNNGYDRATVDEERLAALRIYLYLGNLFITPTADVESNDTNDEKKRMNLRSFTHNLLQEITIVDQVQAGVIHRRAKTVHNKEKDCRVFSESLVSKMNVLLTFDRRMRRLNNLNLSMKVETPTQFWQRKNLPKGSAPQARPHISNPLYQNKSWEW